MRTGNRRCKGLRLRELGPSSEPSAVGLEDQTVGGGGGPKPPRVWTCSELCSKPPGAVSDQPALSDTTLGLFGCWGPRDGP